ncbi:chemotaxis protein CheB [Luteirhabdus pelagi]|uniref:chemotaxis protein CheB n=1 Tax=Luteirhabdus pelagi TaxID=2792783 RepID=UPI00193943B7|nr:chemotaxis protein CheB [Luteirhabdus pelagi]
MNHYAKKHVVVGIGASAGGLEALTQFLENVPKQSKYTYVIVQHLSPNHKSLMGELLSKHTNIPVAKVKDGGKIVKNTVYVVPATNNLVIEDGKMKLLQKPEGRELNLPIDMFFESLAKNYKENAVGVVLSGTGSDGTKGVWHIKENGGLVVAQQTTQAKFDGMPKSVINTGLADYVLPVEDMYSEISNFFSTPRIYNAQEELINTNEETFNKILQLIRQSSDIDFNFYKKPTLIRRMSRRLQIHQLDSLDAYYELLQQQPEEIDTLYKEFLIGVTKFFRDEGAWDVLQNKIIPKLVDDTPDEGTLKIWDVGCSTGEETYSLAMLFFEECKKHEKSINLKIFATDISKVHLEMASKGEYGRSIIHSLPGNLSTSYFHIEGDKYKINDGVRRSIIFSNHNIVTDPPFNNIDLVVCRNLLIYLQSHIQNRVLKTLHFSMKEDSYLMLGTSENLGSEKSSFRTIDQKWKIFQNTEVLNRLPNETLGARKNRDRNVLRMDAVDSPVKTKSKRAQRITDSISEAILDQLNATSLFVDNNLNILEARGHFGNFAKLPSRGFTTSLLKMLPSEYKIPITNAIKKARKSRKKVYHKNILHEKDDSPRMIDLLVSPIDENNHPDYDFEFVITIIERDKTKITHEVIEGASLDEAARERIENLEEELEKSEERLHRAVEETETSNEELQATNEELLASNEELQSTNEELQSVNEELQTVNTEHVQKLEELALLNADMDNLLESTELGVLFLDNELRIRKFTPSIRQHFDLLPSDIGRHLDNFTFNFKRNTKDTIISHSQKVLESGKPIEKRIVSKSGRHFLKRITPFESKESNTEGIVITFIDIQGIIESQNELQESQQKFKDFYESDPIMHISVNPSTGNIVECNRNFIKTVKAKSKKDVVGKSIFKFYDEESKIKASKLLQSISMKNSVKHEELTLMTLNDEKLPVILNSNLTKDKDGNFYTRSTLTDISEIKSLQKELMEKKQALEQANEELEQFVSICSHDLQEPLSTIRFGSDLLRNKFSSQLDEKGNEYVNYIHNSSGRLANQIKALLEHTRIGKDLKKETVDTKELVEVVKYDLSKRIKECDATVKVGNLPKIEGYKTELRLLFQNLIANAIKYSRKEETPKVRVNAFEDGEDYIFSIQDNGVGIKPEDLKSIFTIFNRVGDQQDNEGTGVGLAHCEKIVKLHEGKIWVDSEVGEGSIFYFKLKKS